MSIHLEMSAPLYVEVDITSKCQLNCSYCSGAPFTGEEVSTSKIIETIDDIADMGVYSFSISGGEPTLHSDIIDILNYASSKIPIVMLNTNGIMLSNLNFASKLNKAAPTVLTAISLDSIDININNFHRGESGKKAVKAIDNCASLGQPICISSVLTEENIDNVEEMVKRFFPGVKKYRFFPRVPRKKEDTNAKENFQKKYLEFTRRITQLKKTNSDLDIVLSTKTIPLSKRGKIFDLVESCCCPFTKMYVDAKLNVYPCFYSAHPKNLFGSIKDESIKKCWASINAKSTRERAKTECICQKPPNSNLVPIRYDINLISKTMPENT